LPNIASVLKEEIARVARKEVRIETEALKKASAQYRTDIAALKRRVTELEKQVARVGKKKPSAPVTTDRAEPMRYSAKGLSAQRQRLGLSGPEMATLLGVSTQTIYNWEAGRSRPRQQQMVAIGAMREMGKKEAVAKLQEMAGHNIH
jgi:DNA-binding transcriptional regulator YiaG